jgi:hypothetical protein
MAFAVVLAQTNYKETTKNREIQLEYEYVLVDVILRDPTLNASTVSRCNTRTLNTKITLR